MTERGRPHLGLSLELGLDCLVNDREVTHGQDERHQQRYGSSEYGYYGSDVA
jgi:hypothetical protein